MTVVWSFPTRILFGENAASAVGTEAKALGATRALIVTDQGIEASDVIDPVVASLKAAGIESSIFADVSSNPLEAEVLSATDAYRQANADLVVGVGGGSPIDVAKLVRLAITHPLPLSQYTEASGGDARITKPLPPMIALPTTAGTGSEVGRSAVVTLQSSGQKAVLFSSSLIPNVAVLDPALSAGLPPRVTAATGMDALTHGIEAYCALGDHPMADAIAMQCVALTVSHLETAVHDGKDLDARGGMLKAATLGGVAFQKGLGACHSLAHPLSAVLGMHHGLANALCLPAVLDFNRSTVMPKIARIARVMGVRAEDEETLAFECAGAVRSLRKKIGLPEGLAAAGVSEEVLPKLAERALADPCHQLNPRPCTAEDMLALYRASM